jgi:RND family efflux transporter MFP subunit
MKRLTMLLVFGALGAVLLGGYWYWQQPAGATVDKSGKPGKGAGKRGGGAVTVSTVIAKRQPMPVVIDAVGTVEPENTVAIRPQTNGVLEAVQFKEGDPVKQGQVLFRIDSRPMMASVEQARAALARDQAQLAQAQAQEARLKPLAEKDYITKNEYEVALTQSKALQATVESNRAALQQAQLQLSYASITSPISGRTGSLSVKPGNLVSAGTGGAPLVVINSTQPILVSLSVPQRYLDEVRKARDSGDIRVMISPTPNDPAVAEGTLIFIDNAVSQQTGTIVVKARVKNEKEQLWPGQFVSARIVLRVEENALVLPESAVQPGQGTSFVYLAKDGRAQVQDVEVDRHVNDLLIISKGLKGGEEVIRDVPPVLANNSPIVVQGADGKGGKGEGKGKGKGKGKKGAEGEKASEAGGPAGKDAPAKDAPAKEGVGKDAPAKENKS